MMTAGTGITATAGLTLPFTFGRIQQRSMFLISGPGTPCHNERSILDPRIGRKMTEGIIMLWNRVPVLAIVLMLAAAPDSQGADDQCRQKALVQTIHDFYGWVLAHGIETRRRLEPHIVQVEGSSRLRLDMSSLEAYSSALMTCGCFAPEFPDRIASFYHRSAEQLKNYSLAEFDEMAREGRGPLIDSEDIDVFFCSQEAKYTDSYASDARVATCKIEGNTATAEVITPDSWKTTFGFRRIGDKWLISGYCLYR